MAADLHIIVVPDRVSVDELKFYTTWDYDGAETPEQLDALLDHVNAVSDSLYNDETERWSFPDDVWVGACSPAKAGMLGDFGRYIPGTVAAIHNFYVKQGGIVRITPETIPVITTAFNLPNRSIYGAKTDSLGYVPRNERMRGLNRAREVKKFLVKNLGKDTFCDFW